MGRMTLDAQQAVLPVSGCIIRRLHRISVTGETQVVVFGDDECRVVRSMWVMTVRAVQKRTIDRMTARLLEVVLDPGMAVVAQRWLVLDEQWQIVGAVGLVTARAVVVQEGIVLHRLEAEACDARMAREA